MDIADRIAQKEAYLSMLRSHLKLVEKVKLEDIAKRIREEIKSLEESIEHDRKVQLAEALRSGRKTWRDDLWKYILVVVFTSIISSMLTKILING